MKPLLFFFAVAGLGAIWILNQTTTNILRAQIAVARQENEQLAALQRESDRLRQRQREADERHRRDRAAGEFDRPQHSPAIQDLPPPRPAPSSLTAGEWLPTAAWQNRGRATPTATVETALWAAAGGDIATLKDLLQLDGAVRAKAEEILARLPISSRAAYASAENLIAAFTTKSIPLGDAQLVWQHQPGPDEAVACVFLRNPDPSLAAAPPRPSEIPESREEAIQRARLRAANKIPPMAPPNHREMAAYLSLSHSDDGWRLVVPLSAVEKIAKELGMTKP